MQLAHSADFRLKYTTMLPFSYALRRIFIWVLLALLAVLPFVGSLKNEFALDDRIHIVENVHLVSALSPREILFAPTFPGDLYRPLTTITYVLTYSFFGLNPLPYHLTNLFLHALCVIAVFELLRRLMGEGAGFLAAVLWAVHPIHTEVVANVVGRSEMLAALFGLSSLILLWEAGCGAGYRGAGTFIRCGFATLLSVMAKESGVAFVLVAPLILWWKPEKFVRHKEALVCLLSMIGGVGIYLVLRDQALQGVFLGALKPDFVDNPLSALEPGRRIVNSIALLGKYIALHIAPFHLSADYSYAALTPLHAELTGADIASLGLIILWPLMALFSEGGRAIAGRWALWFIITFIPTSNIIVPIGTIFGERLSYVPGIGVCAVIALVFIRMPTPLRGGVIFIAIFLSAMKCWTYARVWKNNETLYAYQIETSPESAKTQLNYGVLLRNKGELNEASAHVRRSLEIYPSFDQAAYIQGTIYLLQGVPSGAAHWFHEALKINEHHVPSLNSLGGLYLNDGDEEKARRSFEKALAIDGDNIDALMGIMAVAMRENNLDEAVRIQSELQRRGANSEEFRRLSGVLSELLSG